MIAAPNPTSTIAAGSGARTVRTARAASWSWRRNAAAAAMQAAARVNHRSGFSLRRRYSFSSSCAASGRPATASHTAAPAVHAAVLSAVAEACTARSRTSVRVPASQCRTNRCTPNATVAVGTASS